MVTDRRLVEARADGLSVEQTLAIAQEYELVIMHTSTPSFPTDAAFAERLKQQRPGIVIGMVGAKVAVDSEGSLRASQALDFVAREELDYNLQGNRGRCEFRSGSGH